MEIVLVGPGRAGMAVGLAAVDAGHEIVGVLGRGKALEAARRLGSAVVDWDELLPPADLLLIAVRDDAIAGVASRLADRAVGIRMAAHLSGSVSLDALAPLADVGVSTGGFHPLQTLPNAEAGRSRLRGAWVGITAGEDMVADLESLADSIGMHPFPLDDAVRPLYHAGAASAANYVAGSLILARRLFAEAGVPWVAVAPLVDAVVDNAFEMGPRDALTGPIARGDVATVDLQRRAIEEAAPELESVFTEMGRALARLAGTGEQFRDVLG